MVNFVVLTVSILIFLAKAIALIGEYLSKFPALFHALENLPFQPKYKVKDLFEASNATAQLEAVKAWLRTTSIASFPRSPLSTVLLCKEAAEAIERASDKLTALKASLPVVKAKQTVRLDALVSERDACSSTGAPEDHNRRAPVLGFPSLLLYLTLSTFYCRSNNVYGNVGDRVVNVSLIGVPFGLRGTVVGIHPESQFVDVRN